jgi:hypothetical protein
MHCGQDCSIRVQAARTACVGSCSHRVWLPAATVKAGPLLLRRRRRRRRRHGFDGTRPSGRRCMHDVRAGGRPHRRRPHFLDVGADGQERAMRSMRVEVRQCVSCRGSIFVVSCCRVRWWFAPVRCEVRPCCRLQELCDGMPRRWVRAIAPHAPPPSPLTPLPRLSSHPSPVSPPALRDCTMTGVIELDDPADPAVATPAPPPCLQCAHDLRVFRRPATRVHASLTARGQEGVSMRAYSRIYLYVQLYPISHAPRARARLQTSEGHCVAS